MINDCLYTLFEVMSYIWIYILSVINFIHILYDFKFTVTICLWISEWLISSILDNITCLWLQSNNRLPRWALDLKVRWGNTWKYNQLTWWLNGRNKEYTWRLLLLLLLHKSYSLTKVILSKSLLHTVSYLSRRFK